MSQALMLSLTALISAIGGVLGAGFWTFLTRRGDRAAEREKDEIGRLREELKELKDDRHSCAEELQEVKERLAVVEHNHASHLARWIKDAQKRVIWINPKAMLAIFAPSGLTRDQVEGHTFAELLDPAAAAEIDRLDRAALAHPGSASSTVLQLHPDLPIMHIVKVAASGRDGELIYEGYAYTINDREIETGAGVERQAEQREVSAVRLIDRKDSE